MSLQDGPLTVGETLLLAHEKIEAAHDLLCDVAHLVSRCRHYMAKAPMGEAGDAVRAVEQLRKTLSGVAALVESLS